MNDSTHVFERIQGRSTPSFVAALLVATTTAACGNGVISSPSGAGGELAQAAGEGLGLGVGVIADPGAGGATGGLSAPVTFECNANAEPARSPALRRLTRRQYTRSLRDWLTGVLGSGSNANAVMGDRLSSMPQDERAISAEDTHGSLRRLDQNVSDPHVRAWFTVATAIGAAVAQPEYLELAFGSCATDGNPGNDAACVDSFIREHGPRLLRMPLDDATVEFYRGFYGNTNAPTDPRGFADVVAGLLNAPQFLYTVEHGAQPTGDEGGTHALSAHELASRLALHFWDSLPDEELWAAAEDGSLLDEDVYEEQVDRLFSSNKTKDTVREFYRDWLKLDDLPDLSLSNGFAVFRAFAGEDLPSNELHHHMVDEVLDALGYHTWTQNAGVAELLLSNQSFARTEDLAAIYDAPVWNGEGTPPEFGDVDRVGLLTRAAMLSTGLPNTRPVHKGVFIRRTLLCDVIPPPPNNANANIPELSEDLSTREVIEGLTEVEGTSCPGCHKSYINPLGFATEMFDSLGRHREEQVLYDEDGNQVGTAEIDPVVSPQVNLADMEEIDNPGDLAEKVLESGKFEACMARNYFRFSMGRWEDLTADGCTLESLRGALVEADSMADMLRAIALDPAFKQRTFGS